MSNADADIDDDFLDELIPQLEKHLVPHGSIDGKMASMIIARLRRTEAERDEARASERRMREALHALTDDLDCACMGLDDCRTCEDLVRARAALGETGGDDD